APSVRPRRVSVWDMVQASRGKFDRLRRTPAGSTSQALDGYGLRGELSDRPTWAASYPVSVRQVAVWLHASFRRCLATTPLRFANTSPPSGCVGDLHPQAVEHARHTTVPLRGGHTPFGLSIARRACFLRVFADPQPPWKRFRPDFTLPSPVPQSLSTPRSGWVSTVVPARNGDSPLRLARRWFWGPHSD